MRKADIPKAADNELIFEFVNSYAQLSINLNIGGGTKQLSALCAELGNELVKRQLMTQEQIDRLRG